MLANCEKMVSIPPPTTNQWPQNQIDDAKIMEKQGQELLQQHQALKCPRCDSSNTKFCYYNNYSLSQPRHFCKACKRYWTRGGTLRNVPVGGGYRRNNKRSSSNGPTSTTLIKRPISTIETTTTTITTSNSSTPSSTSNHINPIFYGLSSSTNNPCDVNLPFSRFNINSRLSTSSGYDLQPQMNFIGLGFSSGFDNNGYTTNYDSIFSSSASASSNTSVMPSVLGSTLLQHKFFDDGLKYGSDADAGSNRSFQDLEFGSKMQNQIEHMGGFYDPASSLYLNTTASSSGIGVWNDQGVNNIGSSVTSLI